MIPAGAFLEAVREAGFGIFSGVPCSYLTPLINSVISSPDLHYVGAANEGDAVAVACGAELGGRRGVVMFQNSGLGNAVNPLTSLTATFQIPVLVIVTWRGQPGGVPDEPQHALMGQITPQLLDTMRIPWEPFPVEEAEVQPAIERALQHMTQTGTPYALIMSQGAVAPAPLEARPPGRAVEQVCVRAANQLAFRDRASDQEQVLQAVQASVGGTTPVLATTGFSGRALYGLEDRPNQFYMVGSMGCLSSLALGLALVQPARPIVALDGDGALLMRMGALATIGHYRPKNLVHVLLDNGVHESTGGQTTVSASVDWCLLAQACGYERVVEVGEPDQLAAELRAGGHQLTFLQIRTRARSDRKLPRPKETPIEMAQRFRLWLQSTA